MNYNEMAREYKMPPLKNIITIVNYDYFTTHILYHTLCVKSTVYKKFLANKFSRKLLTFINYFDKIKL